MRCAWAPTPSALPARTSRAPPMGSASRRATAGSRCSTTRHSRTRSGPSAPSRTAGSASPVASTRWRTPMPRAAIRRPARPGGRDVDLPGRPGGDPDALRAGARAWDHLAWEVWHLSRPVEKHLGALLEGWSGPAADTYRVRWEQVRRGLGELDHRLHTNA